MRVPSLRVVAVLPLLLLGCQSGAPDRPTPAEPPAMGAGGEPEAPADPGTSTGASGELRSAVSRGGTYTVKWRPLSGDVPRNEHFKLEVWLYRGEEPLPGVDLYVSGWMPDHGHGLVVRPQTTDNGDGSYLVEGMLLHMRGFWQVFFDVIEEEGFSERASFDLEL